MRNYARWLVLLFILSIPKVHALDFVTQDEACINETWSLCASHEECQIYAQGCAGPIAVNKNYENEAMDCLVSATMARDCNVNLTHEFEKGFEVLCIERHCQIAKVEATKR